MVKGRRGVIHAPISLFSVHSPQKGKIMPDISAQAPAVARSGKSEWRRSLVGYISVLLALVFFSGILRDAPSGWSALDFSRILGYFGTMGDLGVNYKGANGFGAQDGFLFAFGIVPGMMLALGIVNVVDHLGGLEAARKMLTPVLRPLMGIPGTSTLALICSLQSTDGGAAMTRELVETGRLTERERAIFIAFQFSAGSTVDNFLSTGAALFAFCTLPIGIPFAMCFIFKFFGANLMRLYLKRYTDEEIAA